MNTINTPAEKGNVTKLIRSFLAAKRAEEEAKAAKKAASDELIKLMQGNEKELWKTDDGAAYQLTVIYGKTSKNLNKDLVEKLLGVTVTDKCYKISNPWNELRITIKA